MKQLVCIGKEYVFRGDDKPDPVTQLAELPKQPQKARVIKREYMELVPALPHKPNNYKPNSLLNLCTDQCRYSLEDRIFCGLKVVSGMSWCPEHYRVVRHGSKALEAAE